MLLIDAIREKAYIEESISKLEVYIKRLSNRLIDVDRWDKCLSDLDELYKKYQQYVITIERAKHKINMKLDDMELSLADAIIIKELMEKKLGLIENLLETEDNNLNSSNLEKMHTLEEKARIDIKTLEDEINNTFRSVDV